MRQLAFVGLGLGGVTGLSLDGLQQLRRADCIFVDGYTSFLDKTFKEDFEKTIKRKFTILTRSDVEEHAEEVILPLAKEGDVVFLVPGDPMISTTHVDLRLRAHEAGIHTKIIHGASIQSAAFSIIGLENYKSGRSVTIPFPQANPDSNVTSPGERICENYTRGLHTLVYLDIQAEKEKFMSINQGIAQIMNMVKHSPQTCITPATLMVGVARVGNENVFAKANTAKALEKTDFGTPPHILIIPSQLHYMEAKALIAFAACPPKLVEQFM